jgi:uncharacterized iron-regulated membrane protein
MDRRHFVIRQIAVQLHRWGGLAIAGFLIVVGLTGSLLAFLPELDHLIAPRLFPGPHGAELDLVTLIRRAEAAAPGMRANTIYLGYRGTAQIGVEPLPGAAQQGFDQIYLDSATGEELGRVKRSLLPSNSGEIMPFIYRLHYALAMGDIGAWMLGLVALAWTIDCFIAFYLTFPPASAHSRKGFLQRWKRSWLVKTKTSFYRLNFDLHRAGGLWLWAILLIFAWSSVFMNLNGFYTKATRIFFDYEQPMWARPAPASEDDRIPFTWEEGYKIAQNLMKEQAQRHGFTIDYPEAFYLMRDKGVFEYRVHSSRDIGDKYGSTAIHFDSHTGALVSASIPTGDRAGNTITTWLIELHMANIFGLAYKIFVCILGLTIVMLSVTGVYIWWKKRRARNAHIDRVLGQTSRPN